MRTLVLVGLLAACDKGKSSPPPQASPPVVAVRPIDAAIADAPPPPPPDAPVAPAAKVVVSRKGVGSLGKLAWWKLDNDQVFKRITDGMGLPGATVGFDVMELPFVDETEEGYFSMKRGDDELAQVLRTQGPKGELPASVVIWTNEIPTADGIRVGDKVEALVAKHPDLGCKVDMYGTFIGMIAVYIACTSPTEPEITYFIDAGKQMFKNGKILPKQLANLAIVGIGHEFVGP